jgi:hypothetical protein
MGLAPTLVGSPMGLAPRLGLARRLGTSLVALTSDLAKNGLNVYSLYFFISYYVFIIIEIVNAQNG